ncbi:MAG: nuclear transport factor 2 family protein [Candidatus Wenzhouxiangella sp. M2_3B_020]
MIRIFPAAGPRWIAAVVCVAACAQSMPSPAAELHETIASLDAATFEAFNRCEDPDQLERYAGFFAEDLEFYHDQGGVTWTREAMVANTRDNACGNYRRELVEGSLEVFPIAGFGAIARGVHRFCEYATGRCDGIADFTVVWRRDEDRWRATRVLSYAHRAAN